MAARDFFPELTTAEVFNAFRTAGTDLSSAQRMISSSSADISATSINEMSAYALRLMLYETLCAKDSETYTWPPAWLRRTRTTGRFRMP